MFIRLRLNKYPDAIKESGLVIVNDSNVDILIRAAEEHQHFDIKICWARHFSEVDALDLYLKY